MKFIKDEEIKNLNSLDDLLETNKYANSLKEVIQKAKTPFTIGLFGEWGSGKSSIVNTAKVELENSTDEKIVFIEYDAWKYANDSFRRMFLKTVQKRLKVKINKQFESFYVNTNRTTKIDKRINKPFLIITLLVIIIGIISVFFIHSKFSTELKLTIPLLFSLLGVSISLARSFFDSYNVQVQNPTLFAPEQFEEIFNKMIKLSLKKYSLIEKAITWIKGEDYLKDIDKLVIVVDNIDRCDKETAYELLTGIKNFLDKDGIIFVVPIDDDALKRHLKEKNNDDDKEADEFLRKFFNITLKIKHFQSRDLFIFTNSLNKKYELNLEADTIDIIAKEYATNPRRIIQLLNNLTFELNLIKQKSDSDSEFVKKYESLICKLLIIREEWAEVYKKISSQPHLLNKYKDLYIIKNEENTDLKIFLERTRAVSSNIDDSIIEKLLSNVDNDLKVSNEILEMLDEKNYIGILELVTEEEYTELLRFIIEDLRKEIDRETFKSGALNRFIDILHLNKLKEISSDINKKLYHENTNERAIKIMINNLDEDTFDAFYNFLVLNETIELDYLKILMLEKHKEIWESIRRINKSNQGNKINSKDDTWLKGIKDYINYSDNIDEIQKLNFSIYYHRFFYATMFKEKWIDENKLKYCIDSNLIQSISRNIILGDFSDDSYQEIIYLSEFITINISDIQPLFDNLMDKNREIIAQNPVKYKAITPFSDLVVPIRQINTLLSEHISFGKVERFKIHYLIQFFTLDEYIQSIASREEYQKQLMELYVNIYNKTNDEVLKSEIIKLSDTYTQLEDIFDGTEATGLREDSL